MTKRYNIEPTYAQAETLYRWLRWNLPTEEARAAIRWLKVHANRREFSTEMNRVKKLYDEHNLTRENCFDSKIWDGYENKEQERK